MLRTFLMGSGTDRVNGTMLALMLTHEVLPIARPLLVRNEVVIFVNGKSIFASLLRSRFS